MGSFRKPGVDTADPASPEDRLARIADLLDAPVEALSDKAQAPYDTKGACELLEIWGELESYQDRERLLDFARSLVKAR